VTPINGPAVDIPEFLTALMLWQVRGCSVRWREPAPNAMEVYEVKYRKSEDAPLPYRRTRLFYPDIRGAQQGLGLLKELNDYPDTRGPFKAIMTGCEI